MLLLCSFCPSFKMLFTFFLLVHNTKKKKNVIPQFFSLSSFRYCMRSLTTIFVLLLYGDQSFCLFAPLFNSILHILSLQIN